MFLNSVHEHCPNSDLKQYTVTKLGWVHSAHTQNPGRAHSANVLGAAARTSGLSHACRTRSQRRSRACWACTCRDTPRKPALGQVATSFQVATSWKLAPCRDIKLVSRHQISVATSNWCRDTTQDNLGRDLQAGSRHCFSAHTAAHVATSSLA